MQVYNDESLYHFGVIGMKWGKQKYDGHTLTDKEKKGISKEYLSKMKKVTDNIKKQGVDIHVKSYNNAANDMNNGGIDKFNKQQKNTYGPNYMKRKDYESDYEKLFDTIYSKHRDTLLSDMYKNDGRLINGQYTKQYKEIIRYR